MAGLPAIVCLKSDYNNKYLRYRSEGTQTHGLLQFAAENVVVDPYAQFDVEPAKTWDGLVHLKSRYSNQYLVRWSPRHYWITASAYAPEEDQSSWACTLFKPIFNVEGDPKSIRLVHVQLGHYACLWGVDDPNFNLCLFAGASDPDTGKLDVFTVVDWQSVFRWPKFVAFRGDNGKYLGASEVKGKPCLQFAFDDANDPEVKQEIFSSPDGTVCIKSNHFGKFWRLGDGNWIWADLEDDPRRGTDDASGAMFRPTVLDINTVALLNLSKTWFCKRLTKQGWESCLSCATQSTDPWAVLQVTHLGN